MIRQLSITSIFFLRTVNHDYSSRKQISKAPAPLLLRSLKLDLEQRGPLTIKSLYNEKALKAEYG
jgi:hypothetical protein